MEERLSILLYNAISLLEENYEHDELLDELGMEEHEYSMIVEG